MGLVDVFRPPGQTPDIARQAVAAGATALWLQLGIASAEARAIAEDAGLVYVEDRCLIIEQRRLNLTPRAASRASQGAGQAGRDAVDPAQLPGQEFQRGGRAGGVDGRVPDAFGGGQGTALQCGHDRCPVGQPVRVHEKPESSGQVGQRVEAGLCQRRFLSGLKAEVSTPRA